VGSAGMPGPDRTKSLVGRDALVAVLRSHLTAPASRGGALLLVGDPGVGKTALLDAAAAAVSIPDTRILRATGAQFEADVSFAALHQLLFPIIGQVAHLDPAHQQALSVALGLRDGPGSDRLMIGTATLALLLRAVSGRPLVVIVDDLPWLDRASALVLGFVARRLTGTGIAFLAAQRSGDESFFERAGIPVLEVAPLSDGAAAELVLSRFPALAPQVRDRVVAESQGIPLALLELPRELTEPQSSAHETLPLNLPLSRTLQAVFTARVAALPEPTRQRLLLAALDGGDTVLAATSTDLDDVVEPAERARLVLVAPGRRELSFSHPLIRSAVVDLATNGERRSAHRVLAAWPDIDPDARAWHLAEATVGTDEEIAGLLEHAAHRVLHRGDAVAAVSTMLRSAELSALATSRARRMTEAAWIGADATGALHAVPAILAQAHETDPDLRGSLPAAVLAAYLLLNGDGDVDTAHRMLVGALGAYEPRSGSDHVFDEALHTLMLVCFFGDRPELWHAFDAAMSRLPDAVASLVVLSAGTFTDPAHCAAASLARLDEVVAGLGEEGDPTLIVRVGIAANFVGRLDGCRGPLLRVIADGRAGGAVASAVSALLMLAVDEFVAGRWDDAQLLAEEGIGLCDTHGYPMLAWPGRYAQALLAAGRGDEERLQELSAAMRQWALPRRAMIVATYARHAAGVAALGRGDFEDAFQLFAAINPPGLLSSHEAYALWTLLDLVEAAVCSNRRDVAALHLSALVAVGAATVSPRHAFLCAGAAAMVAEAEPSATLFEGALALAGPHRWLFDRARLELMHGQRLRRRHQVTRARIHLSSAVEIFERLGARPWAARAAGELRATGQTRQAGRVGGTSTLTPKEHEIAMLAATGMTNRQIGQRLYLSPRTVSAHLYRIFPKLGISARAGLRDALVSHPAPDTDT
jgi:DNA-binding CsgD family transcriptional regulator